MAVGSNEGDTGEPPREGSFQRLGVIVCHLQHGRLGHSLIFPYDHYGICRKSVDRHFAGKVLIQFHSPDSENQKWA